MVESFWENYPIPEAKIKKAIEMKEGGMKAYEIYPILELQRSAMLYWISEYKRGRRWEN